MKDDKKPKKDAPKKADSKAAADELEKRVDELTLDLQRTRADFENYRKRTEAEKLQAREKGRSAAIISLLPVIDSIERATLHVPQDLADHSWVRGIASLTKQLDKTLASFDLKRIDANEDTVFNPDLHEAIQVDEDADGQTEVIAEELQAGYMLAGQVIRPALVKVTRK